MSIFSRMSLLCLGLVSLVNASGTRDCHHWLSINLKVPSDDYWLNVNGEEIPLYPTTGFQTACLDNSSGRDNFIGINNDTGSWYAFLPPSRCINLSVGDGTNNMNSHTEYSDDDYVLGAMPKDSGLNNRGAIYDDSGSERLTLPVHVTPC